MKLKNSVLSLRACALVAAALGPPSAATAAEPAGKKNPQVVLEAIPGSPAKRVTLSPRAAERLGIETGAVSEETVVRKQMVSGLVIPPPTAGAPAVGGGGGFGSFGGFGKVVAKTAPPLAGEAPKPPVLEEAWVQVTLSPGEWERLAKDKPARLLPLATRTQPGKEVFALPSGTPPREDMKRSMLTVYYQVPGKNQGLALNSRMRVELQVAGSEEKQRVVPYGAVYYDAQGDSWVYVNPRPLTYERQRVGVERVVGDLAVLSDGPPVGTPVVTVGAALLYGAEIFGK